MIIRHAQQKLPNLVSHCMQVYAAEDMGTGCYDSVLGGEELPALLCVELAISIIIAVCSPTCS